MKIIFNLIFSSVIHFTALIHKKNKHFVLFIVCASILQSCKSNDFPYFDQKPPSNVPELFAPSIVNTNAVELNVVFNASFTEMFFSRIVDGSFIIHHSELINGTWTPIKPIQMYPDDITITIACDPTITQDGKTMYFLGVDPKNYSNTLELSALYRIPPDVYVSKKVDGKWQQASKVASPVSTKYFESYPIVVGDQSLYFQSNRPGAAGGRDTYRSQYLGNGKFETPVGISLNSEKNASSTYINPDEKYLIASSNKGFQISFKKNNKWQEPILIKMPYEKDWVYFCPYVSPDENYFFFSRRYYGSQKKGWAGVTKGEVYWMRTDSIFNLKNKLDTAEQLTKEEKFVSDLANGKKLATHFADQWTLIYHEDNRCDGSTDGKIENLSKNQIDSSISLSVKNDGEGWACDKREPSSFIYEFNLREYLKNWDRFEIHDYEDEEKNIVFIAGAGESDYIKIYYNKDQLIERLKYGSEDPG